MRPKTIQDIPEELLLQIFEYLESASPSELKSRREPSLSLTDATEAPLKAISQASKGWRRIVLPLLFKYARSRLDAPRNQTEQQCSSCGIPTNATAPPAEYHVDLAAKARERFPQIISASKSWPSEMRRVPIEQATAIWALQFYHQVTDFTEFLFRENLCGIVASFVLLTDQMFNYSELSQVPHETGRDVRFLYAKQYAKQCADHAMLSVARCRLCNALASSARSLRSKEGRNSCSTARFGLSYEYCDSQSCTERESACLKFPPRCC
jgi:hypothetical protein